MKTLEDAIAAREDLGWGRAFAAREAQGVVRFRCEAARCRRTCLPFELRDVRGEPWFGEAGFVCGVCWAKCARFIRAVL